MQLKKSFVVVAACMALIGCGGGDDSGPGYASLVSFGDSLSDVGSYRTPGIAQLGGGKYTVNGVAEGVWVEQLAADLELPALCAAQTGLQASGVFAALAAPVVEHAGCTAYGQGGSRVSAAIGPWNQAFLQSPVPELQFTGQLGQLTTPVTQQVARHLAQHGGRFSGQELVTVLAGANDVLVAMEEVAAGRDPQDAVQALGALGAELAALIRTDIVGKGARRVVVLNLPDIPRTPAMASLGAEAQALAGLMTGAFNAQLAAGLAGTPEVLQVDLHSINTDHHVNKQNYGLTNTSEPACTNDFLGVEAFLGSSLLCNSGTLRPGAASGYLFADGIHPTPAGHGLLRDMTVQAMQAAGWL